MPATGKTKNWTPAFVLSVLNDCGGSIKAAQALGVANDTLWRYMNKHHIKAKMVYSLNGTEQDGKASE